jgi:acyl-CoA reductase-like NAD-dependent aldehyde dehydrogenase
VSEYLVAHPGGHKIAFTGSTAAGKRIAAVAGERLKRVTLELGGKSAAIVLRDADFPATVQSLRIASFLNTGQSCIAQRRVLVPADRYDEFVAAPVAVVAAMRSRSRRSRELASSSMTTWMMRFASRMTRLTDYRDRYGRRIRDKAWPLRERFVPAPSP